MTSFDTLGFATDYSIEIGPEFPGAGDWGCTTVGIGPKGDRVPFLESRWGSPLVVRVSPTLGPEWVASFTGSGGGQLTGVFGSPDPDRFIVAVEGLVFVTTASDPNEATTVMTGMATQVVGVPAADLVLVADFYSLTAFDATGVRWHSSRLCWDDLHVDAVVGDEVFCTGDFLPTATFVIDSATGFHLRGADFGPYR